MKLYYALLCLFLSNLLFAQTAPNYGKVIQIDIDLLRNNLTSIAGSNSIQVALPMPSGNLEYISIVSTPLFSTQPADCFTFSGKSQDGKSTMKITLTPSGLTAIIHYQNSYYFIEPIPNLKGMFRQYNISEVPKGECGVGLNEVVSQIKNGRLLSSSPFPFGSQLRKFKMAAATTGEMTTDLGGQTASRDKVVAIINAANLIYETETAITFELISKTTTSMSLIFTNGSADPFTIDPNFANATNAQLGFNSMNTSTLLLYNEYDVGHVFNTIAPSSIRGQAGASPCQNSTKASGWTEFNISASLASIVGVFVHEVGHQFSATHTYNAIGGNPPNNLTFCSAGWSGIGAIEPGSGSTLMAYGSNCSSPTNYVLTVPNNESYLHTKSIEQIVNSLSSNTCYTNVSTSNSPPVADAKFDITIPKGTPFMLIGSATDVNSSNNLSYAWEQYDLASALDRGALGTSINGDGNYSAVNSTMSAPLFRSRISNNNYRLFPNLSAILNNNNNPDDNVGEDLPQVGRTMKFRFTVRDNALNGGGVDSDEMIVTVDGSKGPFEITNFSTTTTMEAGSSQTLNWSVNNTNLLSPNIKISLSIDGGNSFPYILKASTPNDGSETVVIPNNVLNSTTVRFKISSTNTPWAEFLDINGADLTTTSTCAALFSYICTDVSFVANQGNSSLNLGLTSANGLYDKTNLIPINLTAQTPTTKLRNVFSSSACETSGVSNAIQFTFQVNKSGSYNFTYSNGFIGMTVLNGSVLTCSNFVASSMNGPFFSSLLTVTLQPCITYTFIVYNDFATGNGNLSYDGPGNILLNKPNPVGFNYTYFALNNATQKIDAHSSTSNFTSLTAGEYSIYGLLYENAFLPSNLLNKNLSEVVGLGNCLYMSNNLKSVKILANCIVDKTLVSTQDDVSSGVVKHEVANSITATNKLTGGNTTYDSGKYIELNPGFLAQNGTVFYAYIDGCGGQ